jgi:hypothetical protein
LGSKSRRCGPWSGRRFMQEATQLPPTAIRVALCCGPSISCEPGTAVASKGPIDSFAILATRWGGLFRSMQPLCPLGPGPKLTPLLAPGGEERSEARRLPFSLIISHTPPPSDRAFAGTPCTRAAAFRHAAQLIRSITPQITGSVRPGPDLGMSAWTAGRIEAVGVLVVGPIRACPLEGGGSLRLAAAPARREAAAAAWEFGRQGRWSLESVAEAALGGNWAAGL